jgi:Zinc finger C-x8-C-x5-C-x3-H type (and similar)
MLSQWKKHSPCNYFLKGQCSRGSKCKFSHSTTAAGGHTSATASGAAGTTMGCCTSPPVITPMLTPTGTGSSSQGGIGSDFDYAFQPSLGHELFMVSHLLLLFVLCNAAQSVSPTRALALTLRLCASCCCELLCCSGCCCIVCANVVGLQCTLMVPVCTAVDRSNSC